MQLPCEPAIDVASKDAPVTGIEDIDPSPHPTGFDW